MTKKSPFLLILLTAVLTLPTPYAHAGSGQFQLAPSGGRLEFHMKSTLHAVHGRALEFFADLAAFDADLEHQPLSLAIHIPVATLDTGNTRRDEAMRTMFQEKEFPMIHWRGETLACRRDTGDLLCRAHGELEIRGIRKPVGLDLVLAPEGTGYRASGHAVFSLKDFELKPPSVAGVIRVFDKITISFETLWLPRVS